MGMLTRELKLQSTGNVDMVDLTNEVRQLVQESGLKEGLVTIFVPGSTASVLTMEFEPGLKRDLKEFLEKWLPSDHQYYHNETWHDDNGHSHMRSMLFGPSVSIPFSGRELLLGTWQQIVVVDFDVRQRSRRVLIQVLGE